MNEVTCPHCKEDMKIIDDEVFYNLNRLGKSLYKCSYCEKQFLLISYDGNNISVLRITKNSE